MKGVTKMNNDKKQFGENPTIQDCMLEFNALADGLERAAAAVYALESLLWHEQKRADDDQLLLNGVRELLSNLGDKLDDLKKGAQGMIPEGFFQ